MLNDPRAAACGAHHEPTAGCLPCYQALLRYAEGLEHDAMTGLLRRDVGLPLAERLARRRVCAVVFVDVDGLKSHNDQAMSRGDWAIRAAALATASSCRAGDLAVRWGGDEMVYFGVVGEVGDDEGDAERSARRVADRIARRIERAVVDSTRGAVTVSCGRAVFVSERQSLELVVDRLADESRERKRQKREAAVHERPVSIVPAMRSSVA